MADRRRKRLSPNELLIIESQSFKAQLRQFGFPDLRFTAPQATAIIIKAEKRLQREFTKEEWSSNAVADLLEPSDFTAPYEVIFQ